MKLIVRSPGNDFALRFAAAVLPFSLAMTSVAQNSALKSGGAEAGKQWKPTFGLTVKESYDDNVYMQDLGPQARQSSLVTSFTPSVGVSWKPCAGFDLGLSYAPEVTFYHAESSEDYVAHRGVANLKGKAGEVAWELPNSIAWIDGNDFSPTFYGPGGAPALGGVPLRDRRDALIYKGALKVQVPLGEDWFVRPTASAVINDYQTKHQPSPVGGSYANYVDRNDFNGGLDVGYQVITNTFVTLGYRFGHQDQASALGNPIQYDNSYHRVLFGIEGKPFSWLRLNAAAGPDFRRFASTTPIGFDRNKTRFFVDAGATITPTKSDTIALTAKRFEQPGYGGASVYEDATYEVTWRHKLAEQLTCGAGFRALNWDVEDPVKRNEWWYSPNVMVGYAFDKHWNAEANYSYDDVESLVPNTAGREAQRHLVSLSVKYTF